MPRINQRYLDSVFYLYPGKADPQSEEAIGGTGFFIDYEIIVEMPRGFAPRLESVTAFSGSIFALQPQSNPRVFARIHHFYAVTCAHVIDDGNPVIRLNDKTGKAAFIKLSDSDWQRHPNNEDVAICMLQLDSNHKYNGVPHKSLVTSATSFRDNLGPGDDVFMVGRFINHEGTEQNLPVVRFGNIAMMPAESYMQWERDHKQECFLVEMRSLSGFSGSPVFSFNPQIQLRDLAEAMDPGPFRRRDDIDVKVGEPRLLGIDWGTMLTDTLIRSGCKYLPAGASTGIAGVVPAWKISEMLESEEAKVRRLRASEQHLIECGAPTDQFDKVVWNPPPRVWHF